MPKSSKILIANRGEIALRVIRSVRQRGLSPVAVYSDADRGAMHVRLADEAHLLGAASPAESYLNIAKIIEVAKRARVFGVHPGYGFLSEHAAFARACARAKLAWLGPPAAAIDTMGDKLRARTVAEKVGLRLVPASPSLQNLAHAKRQAKIIGYPVLLKARAGGGGKGMRAVPREAELESAFHLAQSESKKAFADDTLYLEKFLVKPRHIEVQVFGDKKGNVVALGDRECSIQRRYQKIIEEAPAPNLSEKTKQQMAEAACALARKVKYESAGTVEFLVDAKECFFFLEMNTRLQVEHPVTEWVTGLDLVAWQIAVAQGKRLPFRQNDIRLDGHSIEARLYAEDPENSFFPSPGTISTLQWPAGPGVRIDSGIEAGSEVSLHYDPMLAKLSVWGKDRPQAIERLQCALDEVRVAGVKTNLSMLKAVLRHPRFQKGMVSTTFLREEGKLPGPNLDSLALDAALATAYLEVTPQPLSGTARPANSAWWMSGLPQPRTRGTL